MALKDESRMQAYGWSLPTLRSSSSSSNSSNLSSSAQSPSSPTSKPNMVISVPVPIYCRPLFESGQHVNLKLSCASTIDLSHSARVLADCAQRIRASSFSFFKTSGGDEPSVAATYKSSCVWICNLNDSDTHVCVLDANKPSELIAQFTLASIKIYCMQSVSGAVEDADNTIADPSDPSSSSYRNKFFETRKSFVTAAKTATGDYENVSFVESHKQENVDASSPALSSSYPTMWLGSQEGLYVSSRSFFRLEFQIIFPIQNFFFTVCSSTRPYRTWSAPSTS